MKDWHVHIGQYFEAYYDFHDVFWVLKNNGVTEAVVAYLTPRFDDEKHSLDFYHAVLDELKEANCFAQDIGLKTDFLHWADPLVIKSISLEKIFSEFNYSGIAIHPLLHNWTKEHPLLLTQIFEFAQKYKLPLFIHTGLSEADEPLQFEKWFCKFPDVKTHLAHCKDPDATISLFSKHPNLLGDTAFCPHDSYSKICKAGFKDRMLFGTDFPITHWYEQNKNADYDFNSLNKNYQRLQLAALNPET